MVHIQAMDRISRAAFVAKQVEFLRADDEGEDVEENLGYFARRDAEWHVRHAAADAAAHSAAQQRDRAAVAKASMPAPVAKASMAERAAARVERTPPQGDSDEEPKRVRVLA